MKRTEETNSRDIQQLVRLKRIVDGSMSCPEGENLPTKNYANTKFQLRRLNKPRQMLVVKMEVVAKPRSRSNWFSLDRKELPAEEF
jgi:hypothetical protein